MGGGAWRLAGDGRGGVPLEGGLGTVTVPSSTPLLGQGRGKPAARLLQLDISRVEAKQPPAPARAGGRGLGLGLGGGGSGTRQGGGLGPTHGRRGWGRGRGTCTQQTLDTCVAKKYYQKMTKLNALSIQISEHARFL